MTWENLAILSRGVDKVIWLTKGTSTGATWLWNTKIPKCRHRPMGKQGRRVDIVRTVDAGGKRR